MCDDTNINDENCCVEETTAAMAHTPNMLAIPVQDDARLEQQLVQLNGDGVYLNYRKLKDLPIQLFEPDKRAVVRRIYLKHNLLHTLTPQIKTLHHLTEIYLNNNSLQTLPTELFELQSLEVLSVSVNLLNCLPSHVGNLANLKRLQLSHNQLSFLPSEIGQLNHLQHLDVSYNQLEWLPSQVASCTRLQQLSLDHNVLQSLPRELCHLQQLTEISASDNALVWLPLDLGQPAELQGIYVDNNPHLTAMPASTLHKNIGFFRSGREGVPEEMLKKLLSVTIRSLENEVTIALPAELRAVGNISSDRVPLLLELSLAAVHTALCHSEKGQSLKEDEIPVQLQSHLTTPTAHCQQCHRPIFVYGFPIVFRAQVQGSDLPLLGLCCTTACVHLCSRVVHLPLMFPRLEDLALAIVPA